MNIQLLITKAHLLAAANLEHADFLKWEEMELMARAELADLRARLRLVETEWDALITQLLEWAECVNENNNHASISLVSVVMEMRDKAAALQEAQP